MTSRLAKLIRDELIQAEGVRRHTLKRGGRVYVPENTSDAVLFVDSGFVKILRRGEDGKAVLVSIIPPGQIFGEEALFVREPRLCSAEVMQAGEVYEIPRDLFLSFCDSRPEMWRYIAELLSRERELEEKISLLTLNNVESRILHYMASLASTFDVSTENGEYSLPLSQAEFADLIGATRETTSTTLNALARRGILRLRRCLLIVSVENLNSAVHGPKSVTATA